MDSYLWFIMVISHQKSTSATSYVMPSSLCIKDMSIKIQCLIFTFLKHQSKVSRTFINDQILLSFKNKQYTKQSVYWDTWKQRMRSPGSTATHSDDSQGRERILTCLRILIHSSSSAPKPENLTNTSWKKLPKFTTREYKERSQKSKLMCLETLEQIFIKPRNRAANLPGHHSPNSCVPKRLTHHTWGKPTNYKQHTKEGDVIKEQATKKALKMKYIEFEILKTINTNHAPSLADLASNSIILSEAALPALGWTG